MKNINSNAFENQLNSDDELLPEYSFNYQKAKPNRFANRSQAKGSIPLWHKQGA